MTRRMTFLLIICFFLACAACTIPVAAKPEKPSFGFWDYASTLNPFSAMEISDFNPITVVQTLTKSPEELRNEPPRTNEFLGFGGYTRSGTGSEYLGINHLWWSADDWDKAAAESEAYLLQTSKAGNLDNIGKDARYAVSTREYAIGRYEKENVNGKNDRAISNGYRSLSQTYSALGPAYADWRLEEIEHATDADPSNYQAWNDRIQTLQDLGRTEEAADVQHQRDRAMEASAGGASLFLPLSPLTSMVALCLIILGIGGFRKRQ